MSFSYSFFAFSGLSHSLSVTAPGVPMRPYFVWNALPSSLISQNLFELPSLN